MEEAATAPTPPHTDSSSSSSSDSDDDGDNGDEDGNQATPEPPPLRRSTRERRPNPRYTAATAVSQGRKAASIKVPTTIEEALNSPERAEWLAAVQEELAALHANGTWELVTRPDNRSVIPCKWVFKVKCDAYGNVERFKARLVAKGFAQREGIDYNEVFAPVSKYTTLRTLLAKIAAEDMEIKQADVKTAFLYGKLDEEIYMEQPPGFTDGNKVCKLQRSLYGLKQAPRVWYERLSEELGKLGFTPCASDPALFQRMDSTGPVFILAYVDDCLMAAPKGNTAVLDDIIARLQAAFDIRDLGEATVFLGMEITRERSDRHLHVTQTRYITELVGKYNLLEGRTRNIPFSPSTPLESEGTLLDREHCSYSELIGSLLYLTICTRPDIAWSVGALARFMSAPTKEHWTAALGILRYLSGTRDFGLVYTGASRDNLLEGYCDADWAGDLDTRRSTTGFVFTVHGTAVSWASKLQRTVALSSCEAEYVAAAAAAKEALWLRTLLSDLCMEHNTPIIHIDNQAALSLIKNPLTHGRSKHIDVQHHFVRECMADGKAHFQYVSTEWQVADIFTKALPFSKFELCRNLLGML